MAEVVATTMRNNDLVLLSLKELPLDKQAGESLPQLKEYLRQNYTQQGAHFLALVFIDYRPAENKQYWYLRVSETQRSVLQALQGRSETLTMYSYHYRVKLSRELAIFKALDSVSHSRD